MFADRERQAFDLGRRMSKARFSLEDNPFARIHPRLAVVVCRSFGPERQIAHGSSRWPRRRPFFTTTA